MKALWHVARVLLLLLLSVGLSGAGEIPPDQADVTILGMTDDYLAGMASGDFNGDGIVDLALSAPGT